MSKEIKIPVDKIIVVRGHSDYDLIVIHTLLPETSYPEPDDEPIYAHFEIEVEEGTGIEYVRTHFGIEPTVRKF